MGKIEKRHLLPSLSRYFDKTFKEMFLKQCSICHMISGLSLLVATETKMQKRKQKKKLRKGFLEKKKQMSPPPPLPNPARVVILVRNSSSCPVLHLYQASSKYSVGYSCYRAETRNQIQTQKGEITPKVKKSRSCHSCMCHVV